MSDPADDPAGPARAVCATALRSGLEAISGRHLVAGVPPASSTDTSTAPESDALAEAVGRAAAELRASGEPVVGQAAVVTAGKLLGSVLVALLTAQVIQVQGIPSVGASGIPAVSGGGRVDAVASAVVEPAATDVVAVVNATRALTDKVDLLIGQLQTVVVTQQRQNPRWFETPAAATVIALLSLLVALAALARDVAAEDDDQIPVAPSAAVAPVVPSQGGPADGR